MQIIKNLVFGMSWETSISGADDEIKLMAKQSQANAYLDVSYDGSSRLGFCKLKKVGKLSSAAATFAKEFSKGYGIFVHQVTPELACLIVIKNFLPVVDQVLPRAEVIGALPVYLVELTELTKNVVIVHGDISTEEIGKVRSEHLDLDALAKQSIKPMYVILEVPTTNYLPIMLAVVILVGGLFAFSSDISDFFMPAKKAEEVDPRIAHKQNVRNAVKAIVDSNSFPVDVIPTFESFAEKQFPWRMNGWTLDTITCVRATCTALWNREFGGDAKGIQKTLRIAEGDKSLIFSDIGHASQTLTFIPTKTGTNLHLIKAHDFTASILSWFHKLKDAELEPVMSTTTPLVAPPPNIKMDAEDAIFTGTYRFELPYAQIKNAAIIPNFMTIDRIELKVNKEESSIKVTFEGKYYVY